MREEQFQNVTGGAVEMPLREGFDFPRFLNGDSNVGGFEGKALLPSSWNRPGKPVSVSSQPQVFQGIGSGFLFGRHLSQITSGL
jgi:hypothetical protein